MLMEDVLIENSLTLSAQVFVLAVSSAKIILPDLCFKYYLLRQASLTIPWK